MSIPVVFPGCTAATGADFFCGCILAVNSFDCEIYNVTDRCKTCTRRPYSFISGNGRCVFAIGGSCSNRIYVLNNCFEEIGSICTSAGDGPLLSVYPIGCGKLLLTYRKQIVIANPDGSTAETAATSVCDEKDFIAAIPINGGILLAYNDGSRDNIQLRMQDGTITGCTLPENTSIRGFATSDDGTVFGLFAKGYPYRYLAPVLMDGTLNCNQESCFLPPLWDCV